MQQMIKDHMNFGVETIHPTDTLRNAAKAMKKLNVGALPVCEGKKLQGILTDRDIVVRCIANGENLENVLVKDVMSPDVICAYSDQDVSEAAELMRRHHVRRLPIIDGEDRLVGIVSVNDLLQDNLGISSGTLQDIVRPESIYIRGFRALAKPKVAVTSAAVVGALAAVAGAYYFLKRNGSEEKTPPLRKMKKIKSSKARKAA